MAFADTAVRTILEGSLPCRVVLGGACEVGDLLGESSDEWVQADGGNNIPARLVAGEKGADGETITAFRAAVVEGFTGGTPCNKLYLDDPGVYAESADTLSQVVGVMLTATTAVIEPLWSVDPA